MLRVPEGYKARVTGVPQNEPFKIEVPPTLAFRIGWHPAGQGIDSLEAVSDPPSLARRGASCLLTGTGVLLGTVALLALWGFIDAWLTRRRYGPGLMFADVEILGGLMVISALLAAAALFVGARLRRPR